MGTPFGWFELCKSSNNGVMWGSVYKKLYRIQNMSWLVKLNLYSFQDRRDLMKETHTAKWTVDVLAGHSCIRESTLVSIAGRLDCHQQPGWVESHYCGPCTVSFPASMLLCLQVHCPSTGIADDWWAHWCWLAKSFSPPCCLMPLPWRIVYESSNNARQMQKSLFKTKGLSTYFYF